MASPPQHNGPHPGAQAAQGAPGTENLGQGRGPQQASGQKTRPVDLAGLDHLDGEALGLFCWSDVRPLKGILGLVDWRLCGAISRAVESGVFTGSLGDTLLLPLHPRMGVRRLFVFGLGLKSAWDNAVLREGCRRARQVTRLAGGEALCLGAPACMGDVQIEQAFVKAATEALGSQHAPLLIERL